MSSNDQMQQILDRINDMRGFFRFGDEVIPFLGELFSFIKSVMPLMIEVNNSLQDSAHKLPTASDRINDATDATESATTAILDSLDRISGQLNELKDGSDEQLEKRVGQIEQEVSAIINALQFQDITSQKLQHANRILEAIYEKFNKLFQSLEDARITTAIGHEVLEAIESEINPDKRQQDLEEFEEKTRDEVRHEQISQDDIDSLFS